MIDGDGVGGRIPCFACIFCPLQLVRPTSCESYPVLSVWFPLFLKKWYIHNIFTTFLQKILSGKLLLVVIIGKKKIVLGLNLNQ